MKLMPKEPLTLEEAKAAFCEMKTGQYCSTCKMSAVNSGKDLDCVEFCQAYPQEAAEIMGFEIVKNKSKLVETEKPLAEWTLQELKDWCDNGWSDCTDCPFQSGESIKCSLGQSIPRLWKLQFKTRWTKQDIEDAKAIKRVFPWVKSVSSSGIDCIRLSDDMVFNTQSTSLRQGNLFSSLKSCESVRLDDILKSEGN